jgi:hypothetical protein
VYHSVVDCTNSVSMQPRLSSTTAYRYCSHESTQHSFYTGVVARVAFCISSYQCTHYFWLYATNSSATSYLPTVVHYVQSSQSSGIHKYNHHKIAMLLYVCVCSRTHLSTKTDSSTTTQTLTKPAAVTRHARKRVTCCTMLY